MEIIHIVLGKANPNRMNGVNKVVYQLATHQAKAGRKVSIWGITKYAVHDYGNRNFQTKLFKAKKNIFNLDTSLTRAIINSKERNVTFHLHGGWIPTFSTISKLFSKHKIPFVFTPHGAYNSIAMLKNKWVKKIYFQLFEKQLIKRAHTIHCIGKSEVIGMSSLIKSPNVFLMPYGYEKENSAPTSISKKEKDFIIGFIGRLDIYTKGLDLLLNAFADFQKKNPNTKLWIVGDSNEKKVLEKMVAAKKLQQKVVLWGSKFGEEKNSLLERIHLFAHPSRNEGLPSSVLEAASMGIPCLTTEATNMGDAIRKYSCGISVENEDHKSIVDALMTLHEKWEKDQLHTLGQRAIEMVFKEFNWKGIVTEFDKLYQHN